MKPGRNESKGKRSNISVGNRLRLVRHGSWPRLYPATGTVAEVPDSMPEPATTTVASNATPAMASPAKAGASLFGRNCAHCHGDDAKGDEGPSLYDLTRSDARIATIIKEGIKGEMPKFGSKLSEGDIQSIVAFLRTLKS